MNGIDKSKNMNDHKVNREDIVMKETTDRQFIVTF